MISDFVKRATLFAGLTDEERAVIVQHMRPQHFAAHELIYAEDDDSTAFYLIEHGGVRLSVGPVTLATLGAGATFGESGVFLGRRRAVSAETTIDTHVWALTREDLERIVQQHPSIGIQLSRNFGSRIVQVEAYLVQKRLRSADVFRSLTDDETRELAAHLELQDFPAGTTIFRAGEANDGFFILEQGQVELRQGDQVHTLEPGQVFGLEETLAESPYEATATASTDATTWQLNREDYETIAARMPDFIPHLSAGLRTPVPVTDEELALERLRALPLFANLDDDILRAVIQRLVVRPVAKGDIIYKEGDIADALYLVDKGRVEIVSSISRKAQVLARISVGGFFGEMALLTGKPRTTGARAAENTMLWALYRADFEDLVNRYPALGQALSQVLQDRLGAAGHTFVEKHLRLISLFSGLSVEQLEEVAERLLPARYRAGDIIYKAGDPASRIHIIERGLVELRGPDGILTLRDGDFFGEEAILSGEPHLDTAFAKTDGEFWELTREELEALILKYPIVGLNMSRELSRKLHKRVEQRASSPQPVPVPVPATAPTKAVEPVAPAPAPTAPALQPSTSQPGMFDSLALWFGGLSRSAKWRLALIILLLALLISVTIPFTVVTALNSSQVPTTEDGAPRVAVAVGDTMEPVAMALAHREATHTPMPTATYTPLPTDTPIPTDTPTITPTPTNTPTPTPTNTPTPTPTNTPLPTPTPRPVVRAAAAAPAQPTATPKPATQYSLVEVRRLSPCENRGKHNIYVKVIDANGNGVNGIWVVQAVAGNPGQILAKKRTELKDYWIMNPENGRATFDMYKHGRYIIYISEDGVHPASTDITQALDSAFTDEANCPDGGGGNTLFHNSFSVIFRKNW